MRSRALLAILLAAVPALAQGLPTLPGMPNMGLGGSTQPPSTVQSRILADTSTLAPGKPFTIAIELTTRPDWHIYWSNPGDGGITTSFTWTLPDGYKVEPLPLPLPMTFVQPGDIVGYGYTGPTTYLFKVTPAVTGNSPATVRAAVSWLVCDKHQCVPGSTKLELILPLTTTAAPANEELFTKARAAQPHTPTADAKANTPTFERASPTAGKWTIPLTFKEKPTKIEVYPDNVEGLTASDIQVDLSKDTPTISLNARILGGATLKTNRAPVLLVYTTAAGTRRGFFVDLDLGPLGASPTK